MTATLVELLKESCRRQREEIFAWQAKCAELADDVDARAKELLDLKQKLGANGIPSKARTGLGGLRPCPSDPSFPSDPSDPPDKASSRPGPVLVPPPVSASPTQSS